LLHGDPLPGLQGGLGLVKAGIARPARQSRFPTSGLEVHLGHDLAALQGLEKRPRHFHHLDRILSAEKLGQFCELALGAIYFLQSWRSLLCHL